MKAEVHASTATKPQIVRALELTTFDMFKGWDFNVCPFCGAEFKFHSGCSTHLTKSHPYREEVKLLNYLYQQTRMEIRGWPNYQAFAYYLLVLINELLQPAEPYRML